MTSNNLEPPKKEFLANFSQFLAAAHISRVNCDEMAGNRSRQDNLRKKFSASKVNFSSLNFDPKVKEVCARECQRWVPYKKWLFYRYWLV